MDKPAPATVTVTVSPELARLLARLQQLANRGGSATIDLDAWTLEEHGPKECIGPRQTVLRSG